MKLTPREIQIVEAACQYGLCVTGGVYYRLGGHGDVPVRFHPATLRNLQARGLIEHRGYWQGTDAGRAAVWRLSDKNGKAA